MIVVVVGDQDEVERREFLWLDGDRMKAFGTDPRKRGRSRSKNGIGEHSLAIDFQQDGAVAKPGQVEPVVSELGKFAAFGLDDWDLQLGNALCFVGDEFLGIATDRYIRGGRDGVAKTYAVKVGGALDLF